MCKFPGARAPGALPPPPTSAAYAEIHVWESFDDDDDDDEDELQQVSESR